ncbi:replication initiator [Streptomyces sp. NPDC006638]|uniref:replication initiator n=1 Tax=Streptomyces sp. NPDC006638 TaxID=3157183 RepID=UPI0033AF132B
MIRTAWPLGNREDLKHLNLRQWAHMLGFRGHFSTKTRACSTPLGALRAARAAWHRRHTPPPSRPPSSSPTGPTTAPASPPTSSASPPSSAAARHEQRR